MNAGRDIRMNANRSAQKAAERLFRKSDAKQRASLYLAHTKRMDEIMKGRTMGDLSLEEQRQVFNLGMACIAIEQGAELSSIKFPS